MTAETFGAMLRRLREARTMLAPLRPPVWSTPSGERVPGADWLAALAKALGVSMDELWRGPKTP